MDINGKVALVTGGTKGIGAAVAIDLARKGAKVAIVGRNIDDNANAVVKEIEGNGGTCTAFPGDMGEPADVLRCVPEAAERLGGDVDILVHSAGNIVGGGLFDISPDDWAYGFDVHIHAVYHLCRAAIPAMQKKKEGNIVLIGSVAGMRGLKTNIGYQVVKGAIPALARALAFEFADDNIRANAVAPGIIRTDFHKDMPEHAKQNNLDNRIPLHREGAPDHVAQLITQLVENEYITGETITIDGGLTMRIA